MIQDSRFLCQLVTHCSHLWWNETNTDTMLNKQYQTESPIFGGTKTKQNRNNSNLKSAAGANRDVDGFRATTGLYELSCYEIIEFAARQWSAFAPTAGRKNQSSRTRQVLDAVSGLAVSLHLRLYSQRFNQVLLGARGRDLESADHAAVTCCHNTRLNERLQL